MPANITDKFLAGIHTLAASPLPENARHHARRCLLDYLAATIAGARMAEGELTKVIDWLGGTEPNASLIGLDRKASLLTAALVNGISAHTAELDDGVISGIIHPGSPIFSALLPVAQRYRIGGDDLLLGIVTGYEASVRLADAIQPSHKLRGYHATATCGALGAAVGILIMRRAAPSVVRNALSAAAVSASGSLKVLEDNSRLKPFNPGHAAVSAITAVALAESGFIGPDDTFAGKAGFLAMMADEWKADKLFGATPGHLAIERVYIKPYAACRYCHPGIEGALNLRSEYRLDPKAVRKIKVATYRLAVTHHDHTTVESVPSAKMSIPFSVAVALQQGAAGVGQYTEETIHDPAIDQLMKTVEVEIDEAYSAAFPQQTSASVEITLENGQVLKAEVHEPKGDPGNPLSDEELGEKFTMLASYSGMSDDRAKAIRDLVWELPGNTQKLYDLL